ncbi:GldG family protein [Qipengyuania sp. 1NDH17]|uniref:GldG family protein n=1 Tax=Qipengyuania polymorpha TaxID=2867234 RepID=A0ABS7J0V7_9SPHN|nr:GldG family protein [Qipengyuania polymorpha]MBX7457960.1 GldG family protein [Qipengyuania polymorpha]
MPLRPSNSLLLAASLALLAACNGSTEPEQPEVAEVQVAKPKLGLFTTLPIYWGEAGDITEMLNNEAEPDWVRTELETKFEIVPLDTLEPEALEGLDRVLLAQPRPLAPSENVSFDQYLANGGRAVILADPMLTRHSEFGIGDRRRPQDVVLLSPIFQRLGVELLFDEEQPQGDRVLRQSGVDFPVNLAGRFEDRDTGEPSRRCTALEDGLIAQCVNGEGEAYLYADAALLDWEGDEQVPEARKTALWKLLDPLVPLAAR